MGLREDMADVCRANKARLKEQGKPDEVCSGRVELTDAHRQESNGDIQDMLMRATQGCRSGCRCIKAEARIETRDDGTEVVVARCNPDPRLVPFTDPHGR
jgi:hypothetical protein